MKTIILVLFFLIFSTLTIFGQSEYDVAFDTLSNYEKAVIACKKKDYLESQACMIGLSIPDFEGISYDGEKISFNRLKGKVLVLNFWLMTCPPCLAELDGLNEIVQKYSSRSDIEFISFTRETKQVLTNDFFPNYSLLFKIIPDADDIIWDAFKMGWGYPTTIIVSKAGKIHKIISGGPSDETKATEQIKRELIPKIEACLK